MKKESSKINMDRELDLLKKIQRIEVSDDLYDKILAKTVHEKTSAEIISMSWVRLAAAMLIGFFIMESVFLVKKEKKDELNIVVSMPNNMLYE